MWRALLTKDLRRFVRNPVPWFVSLLLPLLITALIGGVFGPGSGGGGLGVVRVAIVDEDDSLLSRVLRGVPTPSENGPPAEVLLLERDEAMQRLAEGDVAAALIVPKGFTNAYFDGDTGIPLQLVKNPAQAVHPAIVEETARILVTLLDATRSVLGEDLAEWRALLTSDEAWSSKLLEASERLRATGQRLESLQPYLAPPLVWYETEVRAEAEAPARPTWNLFRFLLIGLSAMFLLFLADTAMRDLYREIRFRTLERFQTMHEGLAVFIGGKMLYAVVIVLLGAAILMGGGALLFGFTWNRLSVVLLLVLAYAVCAAGLMALMAALAGRERRADLFNNLLVMGLALMGGCMFPPEVLPRFMRENIMPHLPTAWFAQTVRRLQDGDVSGDWMPAALKLLLLGAIALALAAKLFRRRIQQGVRP